MKTLDLFFAAVLMNICFSNCAIKYTLPNYCKVATSVPIIISQRVGETIDSLEREKFNLLTGISDFNSAVFYEIPGGGYVIEITTAGGKYRVVNQDPSGIKIMKAYIDDYERNMEIMTELMKNRRIVRYIRDNQPIYEKIKDPFKSKWHIIDYDDLGLPITKDEIMKYNIKTNRNICDAGCCLSSCVVDGILLFSAIYTDAYNYSGGKKWPIAAIVSVGVTVASKLIGTEVGKRLDVREIIKAIKQARRPGKID